MKWRLTYEGGPNFIRHYLKQLSRREATEDFVLRRQLSYCPAFAKAAVNEIKNSIFQRMNGIVRTGGPKSYIDACNGVDKGVDNSGNSMTSYLGRRILPELMTMARVGVYVDMPRLTGETKAAKGDARPYLYMYRTEQIRSWTFDIQNPDILLSVLLQDYDYVIDETTGLTTGIATNYRHMWIDDGGLVQLRVYNGAGEELPESSLALDIGRIPFFISELSSSVLADVADYQIALLNLESSDLFYALKSNFPFYTEQFDPRTISPHLKPPGKNVELIEANKVQYANAVERIEEIKVGTDVGRRYPAGMERPGFINPSPEPLRVSMEKGDQLKKDIRLLVQLSVENLQPRRASADSKKADDRSLEAGLSYIGLELEHLERQIAWMWAEYEGFKEVPTVNYPEDYSLKTDEERKEEADRLEKIIPVVPSNTFKKEATKRMVELTIGRYISLETLDTINQEIEEMPAIHANPDIVTQDFENGFVGLDTASKIRGYPPGEVEKAKQDHAERVARIAIAQTQGTGAEATPPGGPGARGIGDLATDQKDSKNEKKNLNKSTNTDTMDFIPDQSTRGVGEGE